MTNAVDRQGPPPPDAAEWESAAGEFYRGSLSLVRGTAEKWAGSVAALLGVFSLVAIVAGPGELADLRSDSDRAVAVSLTMLAGTLAIVAIIAASIAAQGVPRSMSPWGGDEYRAYVVDQSRKARSLLQVSRWTGIAAAGLVFATGGAVLISSVESVPAGGSNVVVVTDSGNVVCGKLGVSDDGTTIAGRVVDGARQVIAVDHC